MEQAVVSAAAIRAFGTGAARGHAAAMLELADIQGYLTALAESERMETAVQ